MTLRKFPCASVVILCVDTEPVDIMKLLYYTKINELCNAERKKRMFRKLSLCGVSLILAATLAGCQMSGNQPDGTSTERETLIVSGDFSSVAYFDVNETDLMLTQAQFAAVVANIPTDRYEAYPDTHGAPLTATLYKDGRTITIDPNDPRLIALTNFFNNCAYYSQCAYTQGLLSLDDIEEDVLGADFRLELTYAPYGDRGPSPYGTETSRSDTIIFTNHNGGVTLIAHDLPGYEGQEEQYPYCAVGFQPLYDFYPLLEWFDF